MWAVSSRLAYLLLFSSLCVTLWLATTSSKFRVRLPRFSLEDISEFIYRYEEKIAGIRAGVYEISLKHFMRNGVFWKDASVQDSSGRIKETIAPGEIPLWLEALCILCSFCLLAIGNIAICFFMCISYGKVFYQFLILTAKTLRQVNWYTPLAALKIMYRWLKQAVITVAYVIPLIPKRERCILLLILALLLLLISMHVGIGKERIMSIFPLTATCGLYYGLLQLLPPIWFANIASYVGDYIAISWALCVLVRHYRLVNYPSWKIVPRTKATSRSMQEISCLLDLLLLDAVIGSSRMLPILGPLLSRHLYFYRVIFFIALAMICNFMFLLYVDSYVTVSPLGRIKYAIIKGIDVIFNVTMGWPNIASSSIKSSQIIGKTIRKIKKTSGTLFSSIYGDETVNSSSIRGLGIVMRWIRFLPHVFLLLLPRFVSNLYFKYLTLISPSIRWIFLPRDASFRMQTEVVINFVLAKLSRYLVDLVSVSFLPIKGLAAIAFVVGTDTIMNHL